MNRFQLDRVSLWEQGSALLFVHHFPSSVLFSRHFGFLMIKYLWVCSVVFHAQSSPCPHAVEISYFVLPADSSNSRQASREHKPSSQWFVPSWSHLFSRPEGSTPCSATTVHLLGPHLWSKPHLLSWRRQPPLKVFYAGAGTPVVFVVIVDFVHVIQYRHSFFFFLYPFPPFFFFHIFILVHIFLLLLYLPASFSTSIFCLF